MAKTFKHGDELSWETSQGRTHGKVKRNLTSDSHVKPSPAPALMRTPRSLKGACAGAIAALAWAAQQPLDKRLGGSRYDDVELLGNAITRGRAWPVAGLALHIANGAAFGATYAWAAPKLPGPPYIRGLSAAMVENFGPWPLVRLTDRSTPPGASSRP